MAIPAQRVLINIVDFNQADAGRPIDSADDGREASRRTLEVNRRFVQAPGEKPIAANNTVGAASIVIVVFNQ